jgi:CubicO group peptidase (beta-lactamase class C family)
MRIHDFANAAKPFVLPAILAVACLGAPALALQPDPAGFTDRLRPRLVPEGTDIQYTLAERMEHYGVPGVAVAVIEHGDVVYAAGFGVQQAGGSVPVDADTVFSAGSVSKIATASLILRLAAEGQIDLDANVLETVEGWSLPADADFAGTPVSLRMILSHTAGFNLHGFPDFEPGEALPSLIETLNGTGAAGNDPLRLLFEPGTGYKYSGGGYELAQLLVTETTGLDFPAAARTHLFDPLGMMRSTFANPLPEAHGNIARAHDDDGRPAALPRGYESMPEMAAAGLWTSSQDLGTLVASLIDSYRGEGGALPRPLAAEMLTRVAPSEHGLGPRLSGRGEDFFFHHAGSNSSYQAWIEGHPVTGEGLVVLTNGAEGRALMGEIRNAVADTMGWAINAPVIVPEVTVPPAALEAYAGVYGVDPDFTTDHRNQMVGWIFESDLEVRPDRQGGVSIGLVGRDRFDALVPLSPTRFAMPSFAQLVGISEIEFHRNAAGETTGLTFRLDNAESHYLRR